MNNLRDRQIVIILMVFFIGIIYTFRLLYVQVLDKKWVDNAQNISQTKKVQHPARGLVYDRNNVLLAANKPVFDIILKRGRRIDLDTNALIEILNIDKKDLIERLKKSKQYATPLITNLEEETYSHFAEELYNFPSLDGATKTNRSYPQAIAAHILGYIREVSAEQIENNDYYKPGDLIGISGLEKQYEEELRGQRGVDYYLKDSWGNKKEHIGKDTAIAGKDIQLTIDATIQEYGELLMRNKIGSIVAIEPATGEILSLISSPTFDPNLLSGKNLGKEYSKLNSDPLKPLFNRALQSQYPPGSIFKIAQSLIGMELKVVDSNTGFACNKALVGCHNHPNATNIQSAIKMSCNPYYYMLVKRIFNQNKSSSIFKDTEIGMDIWNEYIRSFGFGSKLGLDFPFEAGGLIPSTQLYNKYYGEGRWAYSTIYSLSIGQGEVLVTPIQMANFAAIIANKGHYYLPHLVRNIGGEPQSEKYLTKRKAKVNPALFHPIHNGMQSVVEDPGGTARRARIEGVTVCGKTGTAENPHGEDHSVFIAFAPRENPKIAIAVYVENAGFGGTWAAPIASLMIEKYLTDTIKDPLKEKYILEADLIPKK